MNAFSVQNHIYKFETLHSMHEPCMSSQPYLYRRGAIPHRMLESLTRAAQSVDSHHSLHSVVSQIRAHEERLLNEHRLIRQVYPETALVPLVLTPVPITSSGTLCNEQTCAICLLTYKQGQIGTVLQCGHGFHKDCLQTWTNTHRTCPMCRCNLH